MTNSSCPWGYTVDDIAEMLGTRVEEFWHWMTGQTISLCDGKQYNHDTQEHRDTACADAPHGMVVYAWDVERFVRGLPVID